MNFTLNQLQIFLKVVQTRSITKASDALNLTQPAVSIQLRNFQDQFDIPLTEIIGRRVHITTFGKEVALTAEKILEQVQTINFKTHAFKGKLAGRLRIASVSTGKYVMPFFITDFLKDNPGVELHLDVSNKFQVSEALEKNETDFAIVSIPPKHLLIDYVDLMKNHLFLIGKEPIMLKKGQSLQDFFQALTLIFREEGSGTRQVMERYLSQNGLKFTKRMELTSNEAVKQAILAGFGYSIMPLIGIRRDLLGEELHIIPVKNLPVVSNWQLIWMKGKRHSPIAEALLKHLEKEKEAIAKKFFGWTERYS